MAAPMFPLVSVGDPSARRPEGRGTSARSKVEGSSAAGLSPDELAEVARLVAEDRRVRGHEEAHMAAAGRFALGGPSYAFTTGPDGRQYAIGGEVQLDTAPVADNPEATVQKAETIQAAANAPADPSTQDRMVAAQAARMEEAAKQELAARNEELVRSAYSQTMLGPRDRRVLLVL